MTEKQLYDLIISILNPGFVAANFDVTNPAAANYVDIRQGDQPTITGRPKNKAVLLTLLYSRRYGSLRRTDEWDAGGNRMVHTELQKMETTFQCGALAPQDPNSMTFATDPTAGDLVIRASRILQSSVALASFKTAGAGIYRITEIREPTFQNDRDQFEKSPSFDFTLNYDLIDVSYISRVETTDYAIYPV